MTASNRPDCLFCTLAKDRIVAETALVITLEDGFPVSPGHTLIIPTGARPNDTVEVVSVTAPVAWMEQSGIQGCPVTRCFGS